MNTTMVGVECRENPRTRDDANPRPEAGCKAIRRGRFPVSETTGGFIHDQAVKRRRVEQVVRAGGEELCISKKGVVTKTAKAHFGLVSRHLSMTKASCGAETSAETWGCSLGMVDTFLLVTTTHTILSKNCHCNLTAELSRPAASDVPRGKPRSWLGWYAELSHTIGERYANSERRHKQQKPGVARYMPRMYGSGRSCGK